MAESDRVGIFDLSMAIYTRRIRLARDALTLFSLSLSRALSSIDLHIDIGNKNSYVYWEMKNTHTRLPDYPSD